MVVYKCPKCQAESIIKIKAVYESSTSNVQTSSTTIGAGAVRGGFAYGVATTQTNGHQQSLLAKKFAPPLRPSRSRSSSFSALSALRDIKKWTVFSWINSRSNLEKGILISILFILGLFFPALALSCAFTIFWILWIMYTNKLANKKFSIDQATYAEKYSTWENSWFCQRCSHDWVMYEE